MILKAETALWESPSTRQQSFGYRCFMAPAGPAQTVVLSGRPPLAIPCIGVVGGQPHCIPALCQCFQCCLLYRLWGSSRWILLSRSGNCRLFGDVGKLNGRSRPAACKQQLLMTHSEHTNSLCTMAQGHKPKWQGCSMPGSSFACRSQERQGRTFMHQAMTYVCKS